MLRKNLATAAACLVLGIGPSHGKGEGRGQDEDSGLLKLQAAYQESVERANSDHAENIAKLGAHYAEAMETLRERVQDAGDLEKTLAVKEEIERFKREKTVPAEAHQVRELAQARSTYNDRVSAHESSGGRRLRSLASSYDIALEKLEKELVRSGDLEGAKAVRAERDRLGPAGDLIASIAGDWRMKTTKWGFTIHRDGSVTSTHSRDKSIPLTSKIEVVDLDERIVKMLPMRDASGRKQGNTAIWRVSEDSRTLSGAGIKGGFGIPAERR